MGKYRITFTKSSVRELDGIPRKDAQRIFRRTSELAENPGPMGYERLSGKEQYRIRQGDYRIVYSIEDKDSLIDIVKIGHRRDIHHL